MGQCYDVELKMLYKNEEGILDALNNYITKKNLNPEYRTDRSTMDGAIQYVLTNRGFEKEAEGRYSSSFDAPYCWETYLYEAFKAMAPYLEDSSFIKVYPDEGSWKVTAKEIKSRRQHNMSKVDITVYASATGLFTAEECNENNLTEITVEEDTVKEWLNSRITPWESYEDFLDNYTADGTESLVWYLLDHGYGLDVYDVTVYKYGIRIRPFGPGCQPLQGFLWREDDRSGKYHDIIVYKEKLTETERIHYSLDSLNEEVAA